jgi:nucleotide-binding universal stress UspA family protein
MDQQLPVTVGFDGSEFALDALRKAFDLASRLGVGVRIVRAWTISSAPRPKSWEPGFVPPIDDFAEAVAEITEKQVAQVTAEFPDIEVAIEVPHGAAGKQLVGWGPQSSVLVVGTRGLGGFADLLIGSVSEYVVEHAKCDVLVTKLASGKQPG